MLRRVRDYAQTRAGGVITLDVARASAGYAWTWTSWGWIKLDRAMLETIMLTSFGGGPVGLETLSAMTGEDASTIEDVYEPVPDAAGLSRHAPPRGRVVMPGRLRAPGAQAPDAARRGGTVAYMKTGDFDYELPQELIAQTPIEPRDHSRLLVYDRADRSVRHLHFYDLPAVSARGRRAGHQ